jgi:HTH-type transcriptional repressor of puuD
MPVTHSSEIESFEADGKRVQVLASEETGATDCLILRGVFTPGSGNPLHSHDGEELVIVLRGAGKYVIADQVVEVREGDVLRVPAGTNHSFIATRETESIGVFRAGTRTFAPDGTEVE